MKRLLLALALAWGALAQTQIDYNTQIKNTPPTSLLAQLHWYTTTSAFTVGTHPNAIATDGKFIWTSNEGTNNTGNTITKLAIATGVIAGTCTVGTNPNAILYAAGFIWVANSTDNTVSKVNPATCAVVGTYSSGGTYPTALSFDGTYLWVTNQNVSYVDFSVIGVGTIVKMSTSGSIITTVSLDSDQPVASVYDGLGYLWVDVYGPGTHGGYVAKIRVSDGAIIGYYNTSVIGQSIAYDGAAIWVCGANSGITYCARILQSDGTQIDVTQIVGSSVNSQGIAFDGKYMWVAGSSANVIYQVDVATVTVIATISTGTGPGAVVVDGVDIWTANTGSANVTKITPVASGSPGLCGSDGQILFRKKSLCGASLGLIYDYTNNILKLSTTLELDGVSNSVPIIDLGAAGVNWKIYQLTNGVIQVFNTATGLVQFQLNVNGTTTLNNGLFTFDASGNLKVNGGFEAHGVAPTVSTGDVGYGAESSTNTALCGSLSGATGCIAINVNNVKKWVPFF